MSNTSSGTQDLQQNHDEPVKFKLDLQDFDKVRIHCYEDLWLDYGSDWFEEGVLPVVKEIHYNHISPEYAVLDSGLRWLFGDADAIDESHSHIVPENATTQLDTAPERKFWVNDELRLRLSATEFRDYVMLADPLVGLADAPWYLPIIVGPTSIPPHFPSSVSRIIRHLPLFDAETGRNFQKMAVDFINTTFAVENPADMEILRRIGAFLALGLPDTHKDTARTIVHMLRRVCRWDTGKTFTIGELLQFHGELYLWNSRFESWIMALRDDLVQLALRLPLTIIDVVHMLHHLQVHVEDGVDFKMSLTKCNGPFYSRIPTLAKVKEFITSLPTVDIDTLANDDRDCAICRGPYGEPGSMLNGDPEGAVKLPCSHVFGKLCLTVLLGPKPEGWGQQLCPVCRQEVPLHPNMIPSGFRQ